MNGINRSSILLGAVLTLIPAISVYADTNPATPSIVTTASGLRYEELRVGAGKTAVSGSRVKVHYIGWLQNDDGSAGDKIDASRDHGKPFQFTVGRTRVISGWTEGVQGMREGGIRRLSIPSALGYGTRGAGRAVPPNADLIFEIELLGVD